MGGSFGSENGGRRGPAAMLGGAGGRVSDRRASGTTGRRAGRIALSAVGQPGVIVVLPASGKQGQDVADIDVVSCLYEARDTLAAAVRPPARRPPPGTPLGRRGDRQGRRPPGRGPRGADPRDTRSGRVDGRGPHRGRGV